MSARSEAEVDPRFERLRATGDQAIRNELVEQHRWLATYCARRFANRGEAGEDLVQVAFVGLVHAVDRYDPARGVAFSTFAMPTIVGELRRHFRDKTWSVHVPRRSKERYQAVVGVVDELTSALGRSPTVDEIARRADLAVDETLEAMEAGAGYRGVPLEADTAEAPDEAVLGVEDRGFAAAEARSVVSSLLRTLPTSRDRRVVELRFVNGLTQSEIARRVGLSQVQVSRLLHANLARMRRAAGQTAAPV